MSSTISVSGSSSVNEGNSGSTPVNFIVTRSGDTAIAASANWAVTALGSTTAADFVGGVLPTGTVSFAAGETSKTVTVNVAGDTVLEPDESFSFTLSAPSAGATLGISSATGTITNDDASVINGTPGNDFITPTGSNNGLPAATGGADAIFGNAGDDNLRGGGGNDALSGGVGNDVLDGEAGNDTLNGEDGNDSLFGGAGNDTLNGGAGNDHLEGGFGADQLSGGADADRFNLSPYWGGAFDFDWSTTGVLDSVLDFNAAEGDRIVLNEDGGVGDTGWLTTWFGYFPLLWGGIVGAASFPLLGRSLPGGALDTAATAFWMPSTTAGTAGWLVVDMDRSGDTSLLDLVVRFAGASGSLTLGAADFAAGTFATVTPLGGGNDSFSGGVGADYISGGAGNDTLNGQAGDDGLLGGSGNDTLIGGTGFDSLDGGEGADTLTGGADADRFVLVLDGPARSTRAAMDVVTDFSLPDEDSLAFGGRYGTLTIGGDTRSFVFNWGAGLTAAATPDLGLSLPGQRALWVPHWQGYWVQGVTAGGANDTRGWTIVDTNDNQIFDATDFIAEIRGDFTGLRPLGLLGLFEDMSDLARRGSSSITTTTGDDNINGNGLPESFNAGSGNDVFNGGAGASNSLSYSAAAFASGVTVTFTGITSGTVNKPGNQTDTFTGISSVTGGSGNDVFDLSAVTQPAYFGRSVTGGAGVDTFKGALQTGDDGFQSGNVSASFGGSGAGVVTLNFRDDILNDGFGNRDVFESIREFSFNGTTNDVFIGTDVGEFISSWLFGNRSIDGGGGSDRWGAQGSRDIAGNQGTGLLLNDASAKEALFRGAFAKVEVELGTGNDAGVWTGVARKYQLVNNVWTLRGTDTLRSIENINGSSGDDRLIGSGDSNSFRGGEGNDYIDGGLGNDFVTYSGFGGGASGPPVFGVTVNLTTGTATDPYGFTDTLVSIESAYGTALADDLTGRAVEGVRSFLRGLSGLDRIAAPVAGTLITADYLADAAAVTVNLALQTATDGWGDADTLVNIQSARGSRFGDSLTGGALNDTLFGEGGDDVLSGGGSNDQLRGGAGNDTLIGGDGHDSLGGGQGVDVYRGGAGFDWINFGDDGTPSQGVVGSLTTGLFTDPFGNAETAPDLDIEMIIGTSLADDLTGRIMPGGLDPDTGRPFLSQIRGGNGVDTLRGLWSPTVSIGYGDDPGGVLVDLATLFAEDGWGQRDVLVGVRSVVGSDHDDFLVGGATENQLRGRLGNDQISGFAGNDFIDGGEGNDTLFGGEGNDVVDGGDGSDLLSGGGGNDMVSGGGGNDSVLFDGGADTASGGTGADTFFVEFVAFPDIATITDFNQTEGDRLSVPGLPGEILLFGGTLPTVAAPLLGMALPSLLSPLGAVMVHWLPGVAGGGWLVVDQDRSATLTTADAVVRLDGVAAITEASFVLSPFAMPMPAGSGGPDAINGTSASEVLAGFGGNDTLNGGDGNDLLDGGAGDDTMNGGGGNDIYVVDSLGDALNDSSGIDTVMSSMNYTLSLGFENLILAGGSGAAFGVGNASTNWIEGNELTNTLIGLGGNDVLDGGAGGDFLFGGTGDDVYLVDSGSDTVDEGFLQPSLGFGGNDTIVSTANFFWDVYSVAETIRLEEDAFDPTGAGTTLVAGVFDNIIIGNSSNNVLFGRGGSDTYVAGDGIDFLSLSTLGVGDAPGYTANGVNTVRVEARRNGDASWDIVFEFEAGRDKIDVSDYSFASAAEVLAKFTDTGPSTYALLGDGLDILWLVNVNKAALSAADFIV
jgi:Ca2+-binding RTX toxin-like protein